MPTIEIASIKSEGLNLKHEDFGIAIIEEKKLRSHRDLFYDFLIKQEGTIIHLGNPEFKEIKEQGFYAGELINWNFKSEQGLTFQFIEKYKKEVDKLLKSALISSSVNQIYFLTDIQSELAIAKKVNIFTISELWTRHDQEGLAFNTMYEMSNI